MILIWPDRSKRAMSRVRTKVYDNERSDFAVQGNICSALLMERDCIIPKKKKATIEITYPTARRLLRLLPTRSKALLTQTSSGSLIPPTKPATNPPANVSPAPVVLIISSGLITGGV